MGDLDDVYTLKVEVADKPEEICVDGCVYTRSNASNAGEEYCFKNQQSEGSLVCQVTSGSVVSRKIFFFVILDVSRI